MISSDEILKEVQAILSGTWETRDGYVIPEVSDIALSKNEAVELDATVLYADMRRSTYLVDNYTRKFSAEIYKMFLLSSSKIIQAMGGYITAFDGDRVMSVFLGDYKNSDAAKTAMHIKYLVTKINEKIYDFYKNLNYKLDFGIGIDTGKLFATRTGIWKYNDILWLGNASNYAAKYSELGQSQSNIVISKNVYSKLINNVKYHDGKDMWTTYSWDKPNIYKTTYYWEF